MGLEIAAATVAAIAAVGKGVEQTRAANEQERALDLESKELQLQTQDKTLSNYDVMEKTIASQIAHQTVTGTALSSPSFNAIQRNTVNIVAKKEANNQIEGEFGEENLDIEKKNVKSALWANLFGDAATAASQAYGIAKATPTS